MYNTENAIEPQQSTGIKITIDPTGITQIHNPLDGTMQANSGLGAIAIDADKKYSAFRIYFQDAGIMTHIRTGPGSTVLAVPFNTGSAQGLPDPALEPGAYIIGKNPSHTHLHAVTDAGTQTAYIAMVRPRGVGIK